ncbi:MAG: hypothetical protein LC798_05070 [Chloroflexi bacterium]|nr:hypothetical protein [Chloroflexota bacterium]
MRRVIRSVVMTSTLLLLTAQLALGARPIHEKFTIDESFSEDLCGVEVTAHVQIKGNVLIFEDRAVDVSRVKVTWTNEAGDWLQNTVSGPVFIEERLDGDILTITTRHAGVHSHLVSAAGREAAFDRGTITFVTTIDLNDLEDQDDDVFLGSEVVARAGPHPEADSGFELFCEVVNDVLG